MMFGPIGARQTSLESQDVSMITLSAGWLTSTALLGGGTFPGNLSFMCLSLSMTERIGKKKKILPQKAGLMVKISWA